MLDDGSTADDAPTEVIATASPEPPRTGTPTPVEPQKVWRFVGIAALCLALLAVTAVGGFFVGQGTRKSDAVVAIERRHAVDAAVQAAVAQKGAADKAARLRIMHRAATRMNAKHRAEVRLLRKSAQRRADNAYSAGSSAGRAAGYSDGVDDGITKASDDLVCSDDPDVPLPYCY